MSPVNRLAPVWVPVQTAGLASGAVLVQILPSLSAATHSVDEGHETPKREFAVVLVSKSVRCHAGLPPAGLLLATTFPC
jgi:hypothetical protein